MQHYPGRNLSHKESVKMAEVLQNIYKNIRFCTDSKAAINSLSSVYTTSRIVPQYQKSLVDYGYYRYLIYWSKHFKLQLLWIPGHIVVAGNLISK